MASRMGDQVERFKDFRRRRLPGQLAQLTLAGAVALAVLVAAVVALPRSKTDITATQAETDAGVETAPADAFGGPTTGPGKAGRTSGEVGSVATGGRAAAGAVTGANTTTFRGAPAAPPGVNAPGVTKTEILVGAAYDKNAGALNTAYGFAGVGQIDQKRAIESIRDYINRNGGIGGRKIRIVWHEADQLDNKTSETRAQETCTTWTQGTHVFAALAGGYEPLDACLHKAGVVEVSGPAGLTDSSTYKKYPYLIELGAPALDRMARLYADEMMKANFYKQGRTDAIGVKGPFKLGVVTYDYPVFRRNTELFKRELAKRGVKVSEVAYVKFPEQNQDVPQIVADVRSAVLRFKSQNVTHVNFNLTSNGFVQLTFWQQSDDQEYYPRYGLSSNDSAQALISTFDQAQSSHKPGSASARTLPGAVGVGWFPLFDVPRADYSGNKETSALRLCKKILSHESFDDPSRNKEAIAAIICDPFFYLKAVVEKGGRVVNQRTFLNGVATVGSVPSAGTFDMATTATRHDGMNATRKTAFFTNCTCFHYTGPLKRV